MCVPYTLPIIQIFNASCVFDVGEVRMPSGKVAKPDITDNKDGTVTVRYAPTEAGLHEMDIKYDGLHIPGRLNLLTYWVADRSHCNQ